jgi:hypothetical protein
MLDNSCQIIYNKRVRNGLTNKNTSGASGGIQDKESPKMVKPSQVNTDSITPEQIGKCTKVLDCQTHQNFYLVENESGNIDDEGHLIEYKVTYSSKMGFQCTCKAGQEGLVYCKNGYCKHVAWAVAAAKEEKAQGMKRIEAIGAVAFANSIDQTICKHPSCLQVANPTTGTCNTHMPKSALDKQVEGVAKSGMPAWMITGIPKTVRSTTVYPRGWK